MKNNEEKTPYVTVEELKRDNLEIYAGTFALLAIAGIATITAVLVKQEIISGVAAIADTAGIINSGIACREIRKNKKLIKEKQNNIIDFTKYRR